MASALFAAGGGEHVDLPSLLAGLKSYG